MGAFFILRGGSGLPPPPAYQRMRAHFQSVGFSPPLEARTAHWCIAVYPKLGAVEQNLYRLDSANFAFTTGTLLYKQHRGVAALAEIFKNFSLDRLDAQDLHGVFALGLCKAGRFLLLADRLGVYKLYHDESWSMISSSFLAILDNVERPSANKQGIYEYIFQAATYGCKTPIQQVESLDHHQCAELGQTISFTALPPILQKREGKEEFQTHVKRTLTLLRSWFREIVSCFGENIGAALSGGYDSRLILALLREQGVRPRLHVYGSANDPDVRVANAIAKGEGLRLLHVDRASLPRPGPEAFSEIVIRNCLVFDGFPVEGIFDNGSDLATRTERAGGALALNGGGGEIYRNFFQLPDRAFSVRQFIWAFYSQFDPATCSPLFSKDEYTKGLATAIRRALNRETDQLSRCDIEYLYPGFRCNYWMGLNNSTNNRLGFSLTPFIEYRVVVNALQIPIGFKDQGRFEAALIRGVSPVLARYPSVYGHDFAGDVPLEARLRDRLRLQLPPFLRRYAFRLKSRLSSTPRPYVLSESYISRVIDPLFPFMSKFFRVGHVRDHGQFARLCTLEFLFARYRVDPGISQ